MTSDQLGLQKMGFQSGGSRDHFSAVHLLCCISFLESLYFFIYFFTDEHPAFLKPRQLLLHIQWDWYKNALFKCHHNKSRSFPLCDACDVLHGDYCEARPYEEGRYSTFLAAAPGVSPARRHQGMATFSSI